MSFSDIIQDLLVAPTAFCQFTIHTCRCSKPEGTRAQGDGLQLKAAGKFVPFLTWVLGLTYNRCLENLCGCCLLFVIRNGRPYRRVFKPRARGWLAHGATS